MIIQYNGAIRKEHDGGEEQEEEGEGQVWGNSRKLDTTLFIIGKVKKTILIFCSNVRMLLLSKEHLQVGNQEYQVCSNQECQVRKGY